MQRFSFFKLGAVALWVFSTSAQAAGMVPETSVVIVEQSDGEGAVNLQNTDAFPVLLITTLVDTPDDSEALLIVTPPAARVEPGKTQRVRFIITSKKPLQTERLKRVTFDGIPPQQKGKSELRTTIRQNLPIIIRPAGLEKDLAPWKRLTWKASGDTLIVSNASPYVIRLGQAVQTLPDDTVWLLPNTYVLPGQTLTMAPEGGKKPGIPKQVRISPATTWGYAVNTYDASLSE